MTQIFMMREHFLIAQKRLYWPLPGSGQRYVLLAIEALFFLHMQNALLKTRWNYQDTKTHHTISPYYVRNM
jgi:hypothetical protein